MEGLILSMVRFSTALTLFGVEQMQTAMSVANGTGDVSRVLDRFQSALESMSDSLTHRLDHDKKETMRSMMDMSEEVVHRTFDGINTVDPRQVMRATNDLVRKSSDAVSGWINSDRLAPDDDDIPRRAADVLG